MILRSDVDRHDWLTDRLSSNSLVYLLLMIIQWWLRSAAAAGWPDERANTRRLRLNLMMIGRLCVGQKRVEYLLRRMPNTNKCCCFWYTHTRHTRSVVVVRTARGIALSLKRVELEFDDDDLRDVRRRLNRGRHLTAIHSPQHSMRCVQWGSGSDKTRGRGRALRPLVASTVSVGCGTVLTKLNCNLV